MDRLRLLRALAATEPHMSLPTALSIADAVHAEFAPKPKPKFNFAIHNDRVAFARTLPQVMSNLPDRKIQAIKELRSAMQNEPGGAPYAGLLECKNAVEAIAPPFSW